MKNLTLVFTTCGEPTSKDCLKSIESFRNEVKLIKIKNVYPQIKALNKMINAVKTEFFIPLDADMILYKDAWPRIQNAINKHKHNPNWHSILFQLYDTLTEKNILALKILRTSIMKENLFEDVPTPDVAHYKTLTDKGYSCIHDYLKLRPIGSHVLKGKHFCYNKFRDVYQTYRFHNFEWDSGVFMGGDDLRSRAKAHHDFFIQKWIETNNIDYMHCLAGMMDGILSPIEKQSKNLKNKKYLIKTKWAVEAFYSWYMPKVYEQASATMLF